MSSKNMYSRCSKPFRFVAAALAVMVSFTVLPACSCSRWEYKDSQPDCIIAGKEVYFADDEQKQTWVAPIAELLGNELIPYGDKDSIVGYRPLDPDKPSVPASYRVGIGDITLDGQPEIWLHPLGYGGSSGNATYYIFTLSGEKLGEVYTATNASLCMYYNIETGMVELINQYSLRYGWPERDLYVSKVGYAEDENEIAQSPYLRIHHELPSPAAWLNGGENAQTTFYLNNNEVSLDRFYEEYDHFFRTYVRIPQSEVIFLSWSDVTDDDDEYEIKALKMAQAIVSTEQCFILP